MTGAEQPKLVLVFSGKRKSGKDHTTEILKSSLGDKCALLRLSAPLKQQYALEHGLDYARLLDASSYKEQYRADMIAWGEARRTADPGFFADIVVRETQAQQPMPAVWIVVDARRPSDLAFFASRFPCLSVRVTCPDDVRTARGWVFTQGVDDVDSECALDGATFDVTIVNDGDQAGYDCQIQALLTTIEQSMAN